jgi:hypothetical protein
MIDEFIDKLTVFREPTEGRLLCSANGESFVFVRRF